MLAQRHSMIMALPKLDDFWFNGIGVYTIVQNIVCFGRAEFTTCCSKFSQSILDNQWRFMRI